MGEKRQTIRIAKRTVDAAQPAASTYRLWDAELKGFGLRITASGSKTYFVFYRAGGGRSGAQREFTIGRHGVLTPDQARKEAERLLSAARLGGDPQADRTKARADLTVAELCYRYLADGVAIKKASTLTSDRFRIEAHIKPLLGRERLSSVTSADVERFMRDVADGRTAVIRRPSSKALRASGVRITAERNGYAGATRPQRAGRALRRAPSAFSEASSPSPSSKVGERTIRSVASSDSGMAGLSASSRAPSSSAFPRR